MRFNLFIIILTVILIISGCSRKDQGEKTQSETTTTEKIYADSMVIELEGVDSLSVFEVLQAGHEVDYKATAMGVFIQAIDSIGGDSDYFWIYAVNDSVAQIACDKYITGGGDRIKWMYRKAGN